MLEPAEHRHEATLGEVGLAGFAGKAERVDVDEDGTVTRATVDGDAHAAGTARTDGPAFGRMGEASDKGDRVHVSPLGSGAPEFPRGTWLLLQALERVARGGCAVADEHADTLRGIPLEVTHRRECGLGRM